MPNLLLTFFIGLVGITAIAFGFLYNQDHNKNDHMKWYDVLKTDLPVRVLFWTVGLAFLAWGGYFQFMTMTN